jgi:hypothetical protein
VQIRLELERLELERLELEKLLTLAQVGFHQAVQL